THGPQKELTIEARYAFRNTQLLEECQVALEIFEQVMPRLSTFMEPFVKIFHGQGDGQHAKTYVYGLLSDVERKNIESIAYRFGQSRLPLQGFIGWHQWDDEPLRQELRSQVKTHLGSNSKFDKQLSKISQIRPFCGLFHFVQGVFL